ncbi:MAG: insulinase family protein [Chloroflexi bacterium]|nr:insulinase family protein [Chloroflexota bacterium]MCI0576571.1 insulinase family protein [Chloroflexota bacterium]MCI0643798.1 insulinase family protein [Chloroflexota bacterium]MCI0726911.1 insulinase family protein [Chloroflexota bacterium]
MSLPVFKTTLDNGLTVVLREMHHAPVTSFWLWYRIGSRNEKPGMTGASHWVEHMMFKGSPQFPPGSLDRLVSREGGRFNAFTWVDFTAYFETMPSDRIDLALRLESDRMVNAIMSEEAVNSERTVIISERHMYENQPTFLLREELMAAAFRVHSYHHDTIGDEVDLETMTRDDLYSHYRRYYTPNNAVIVAVGDFETQAMLARINELYGAIPSGSPIKESARPEPPQRGERRVTVSGPGDAAYLVFAFHAPAATHPDFYPLVLLNAAYAGGSSLGLFGGGGSNKSSRLYKALVATDIAAAVSGNVAPTMDPYLYTISAVARPGRTLAEVEAALQAELDRLDKEPVTQAELDKALKRAKAQFVMAGESVTGQGQMIGMAEMIAGDYRWYENTLDAIAAVTLEDMERVRRQYLRKENRVVGWYEPAGNGSE